MRLKNMIFSWTGAALIGGILATANFIFSYVPLRLDASKGQLYSISKGTKQLLKGLDDTLVFKIVFSGDLPSPYNLNEQYVRDLLGEYRRASHGKIRIEYLDPGKSAKAREEAVYSGVPAVQLDVRARDRREVAEKFMGISIQYGDQKEVIPMVQDTLGLEYEITSRVKRLIKPGKAKIGFVSNGGSLSLSSSTLEALQQSVGQLYDVASVDLKQPFPEGLKALWILGPMQTLGADEVAQVKTWAQSGGTLGLLIDRFDVKLDQAKTSPVKTGLEDLLKEWGIEFRPALVVDPQCDRIQIRSQQGYFQMINVVDYPYIPLVTDINRDNPATKPIDRLSLSFVSPLFVEKEIAGLRTTPLARTSKFSWLDANPFFVSPLQRRVKPPEAAQGPFNAGLLIEGAPMQESGQPGKSMRVIVFGSSKFIRSDYPQQNSNLAMFTNLLDWSVQDEILLSIRSKESAFHPLKSLSDPARVGIKGLMIFVLPLLSLLVGFVIWFRQRTRRALLPLRYREGA